MGERCVKARAGKGTQPSKRIVTKQDGFSDALERIEASSYRLTQPRRRMLEAIFDQKGPFSVPSLEKFLNRSSKKHGCDTVTIYRTLPVFEELGIIEKCDFSDGMAHYEVSIHHGEHHHHHHFVCRSCKKVEPLDFCIAESQEQLLRKLGYTDLSHRLEFSGVCPACSAA